jgi:hypothetical protein
MRIRLAVLLAVLLAAVSIGIAVADDPMEGTWKLNPSESRYSPGPAPEEVVMTVEPAECRHCFGETYRRKLDGTDKQEGRKVNHEAKEERVEG